MSVPADRMTIHVGNQPVDLFDSAGNRLATWSPDEGWRLLVGGHTVPLKDLNDTLSRMRNVMANLGAGQPGPP